MHQILGPLQVNVGDHDNYSVTPADGLSYTWTVAGCNILDGQGTSSIDVLWTIQGQGSIQVDVKTSSGDDIIVIDPTAG
jgi:hypothetical protein